MIPDDDFLKFLNYAQYGGNILIYKNRFKDIVGCPTAVDASLVYIGVVDESIESPDTIKRDRACVNVSPE